jgi:DNA processing protein
MPLPDEVRPSGLPPGLGDGPGEADALLLLRCLLGITPRALHAILWREGTATATIAAILAGEAGSDADRGFLTGADPTAIRARLAAAGARFAGPSDPDYCAVFSRLEDPPVGIFVHGLHVDPLADRVAVIGSRTPTPLGREVAQAFGAHLAAAGVSVVSGGALGIDIAAHTGALRAGGHTIAVLGSGIDMDYPATNRPTLRRIRAEGTVVSEYPPGVPAEPFRFPARNRIIAALSRGVVVVEAAARSGTRSTAEHALELGLEVFAVPGPVTSPLSEIPLELLRDGARVVRGAADVLEDLGIDPADRPLPPNVHGVERRALAVLTAPLTPDAIARAAGMSIPDTIGALSGLELRGLVRAKAGRYERTLIGAAADATG